jgi:predicted nucleic acid-binding protein
VILLDTSVLSVAFRRRRRARAEARTADALARMIARDLPLAIPGIVLQELLSGVHDDTQFARLSGVVEPFPLVMAERRDHVMGARIANACRRRGLAPSTIDCLIAALAVERDAFLFTLDDGFRKMAPHCGLKLVDRDAPEVT